MNCINKEQSILNKLFSQSFSYFIATAVGAISHFVTFPIYTRIFSVSEYGILGMITVTISTLLTVSKLGLGNSAVRFYEECRSEKEGFVLSQFYSTCFWATVGSGCSLMFFSFAILLILNDTFFSNTISNLLYLGLIIVVLRTIIIILQSFFRAEQKATLFSIIQISSMYIPLLFGLIFVLFFMKNLTGFFLGQIIAFSTILTFLLLMQIKRIDLRIEKFSYDFLKKIIKFGIPLLGLEFFNHILSFADRYIIQYYCGAELLGIYSVGYNLSSYLGNLFLIPISMALTPVLMETWSKKGKSETQKFLTNVLKYYMLGILPVTIGFIAVSQNLIPVLASSKYISSYKVVPIILPGIVFFTLSYLFNAGLIIEKKTSKIIKYAMIASLINLSLNYLLIPRIGITGAAYATLFSYFFFFTLIVRGSFTYLPFKIPYLFIIKYLIYSGIMYFIVNSIHLYRYKILTCLLQVVVGIFVYCALILTFEVEIRSSLFKKIKAKCFGNQGSYCL